MTAPAHHARIASRALAGTVGVWAFAFAFMAASVAGLAAAGLEHAEATSLSAMLALLLLVAAHVWTFAVRRLAVLWSVLGGGAVLMGGAAWLAARALAA